ncbi:MAG: hypothetical protein IKD92_06525 [Lachnospiraceae bacterium]|nr:hypothetical protein [Lachnospiraceae bacterium]
MYSDKEKKKIPAILFLLLAVAAAALVWYFASHVSARDLSEESAAAIREAIRRSALQCYAVEGVYPPTLEYLEDNYGLQVNTRDYYIRYDIFASNIAPEVTVTAK